MHGIFYRTLVINMSVPCRVNGKCAPAHYPTGGGGHGHVWRLLHTLDGGLRLCALIRIWRAVRWFQY